MRKTPNGRTVEGKGKGMEREASMGRGREGGWNTGNRIGREALGENSGRLPSRKGG